jgi:membrane protein DedA with SNARE-associated domain
MTNTDRFLSFAIWVFILGFIGYQLFQEVNMGRQCRKDGGVVVVASNLTGACVRPALGQLDD